FIGSPAMNFFPASTTATGLRLPFGEIARAVSGPADVVVGVRPEHFEDAALADAGERARALTFRVNADLVESLGADKYVYFSVPGAAARSSHLAELAESGVAENRFVARVSAESMAKTGHPVDLAMDITKLHVFDPVTGSVSPQR
ncbi:MAG: ABC transporter ATP-binding protein, partial [Mycobacterium sp.]|nr:ABC transporter ATP-binding protein [Mycobacterium sp.]